MKSLLKTLAICVALASGLNACATSSGESDDSTTAIKAVGNILSTAKYVREVAQAVFAQAAIYFDAEEFEPIKEKFDRALGALSSAIAATEAALELQDGGQGETPNLQAVVAYLIDAANNVQAVISEVRDDVASQRRRGARSSTPAAADLNTELDRAVKELNKYKTQK